MMIPLLWLAVGAAPCTVGERATCAAGLYCAAELDVRTRTCPERGVCAPLPPATLSGAVDDDVDFRSYADYVRRLVALQIREGGR